MNDPGRSAPLPALALALAALALAAPAQAADDLEDISIGVGLAGQLVGSFLDRPDDMGIAPGDPIELVYPGFGGAGAGLGALAEIRYKEVLGFETGLFLSEDQGSGFVNLVKITIGQTSLHWPLLLKGVYPGRWVQPQLSLGVEIVLPQSLTVATDPVLPSTATLIGGQAGNYALLIAGFGVEFKLPFDGVDLRVPLQVRGGFNPGTPEATRDRGEFVLEGLRVRSAVFISEWQYHLSATLGLSVYLF